jgi:hypothetical protein
MAIHLHGEVSFEEGNMDQHLSFGMIDEMKYCC